MNALVGKPDEMIDFVDKIISTREIVCIGMSLNCLNMRMYEKASGFGTMTIYSS